MAGKETMFSLRLDDDIADAISSYAKRNKTTKAAALNHYARIGLEYESNPNNQPVTRADLLALGEKLQKSIAEQPIQIQQQIEQLSLPSSDESESERESAALEERRKIAAMGFFDRRKYLRESTE